MSEANETTPEGLPKSNDPSLEELAENMKLGPGDLPPPPGYDPSTGLPPSPPVPEPSPAPAPDEPRTTLGDVPHPELRAPVPMPAPGAPAPPAGLERRLSSDIFEIEPGTLPPHRYAAFFPLMSPSEYEGLVTSIAVSGQEYLAVRFQGQLLDGITDSHEAREFRSLRRELNGIWRDPDRPPNFVKLLNQFLAQFRDAG